MIKNIFSFLLNNQQNYVYNGFQSKLMWDMIKRKPILIVDDSFNSQKIKKIFNENKVDFVEYHVKKIEESCCGELPTTKAPSVIAKEGIFKDEENINNYITSLKEKQLMMDLDEDNTINHENESAYW